MKNKINTLILVFMALSSLFTACQRNGDMPDGTDANSTVDHLIFKEVFYIGYCTYRDLSSMGFKSQYSRYEDANYLVIYNPTHKPISLENMAIASHAVDQVSNIHSKKTVMEISQSDTMALEECRTSPTTL